MRGAAPSLAPVRSARRGGKALLIASAVAQVSALLRYVFLARLLGPEQLGLAATLVVTGSFFDLISETGSDRFLIQDRDGDLPAVQKLVQLVYVGRGAAIALALALSSIPIAYFYGQPKLAFGLALMGLVPLTGGFLHLDVRRQQRVQDFRAEAISQGVSEAASLVAVVIAAWITRSYTAILYGLVVRSIVLVIVSHLRAERPYGLAYSRVYARRLAMYAAPLMLTGLMLFVGSQGDRVMVANTLGVRALGLYSSVLLLIYYPSAMVLRYIHAINVPIVAFARDHPEEQDRLTDHLGGQTLLLSIAMAVGFALVAPFMVPLLYGQRYAEPATIIGLIGILQATRFFIVWPSTVALSMGRTRTVMFANLMRLTAYPAAYVGLICFGGLFGVAVGFTTGEIASIVAAVMLVNRDTGRPLFTGFDRVTDLFLTGASIMIWNVAATSHSPPFAGAAVVVTAVVFYRVLRREGYMLREAVGWVLAFLKRSRRRLNRAPSAASSTERLS